MEILDHNTNEHVENEKSHQQYKCNKVKQTPFVEIHDGLLVHTFENMGEVQENTN